MIQPNNVTRLLDGRNIPYTAYELPPEKLGAIETARLLGEPPGKVFKTIVVTRQAMGKPILALVPGNCEVNLKALAKALGVKKVALASEREAERLTGLKTGGISPLALLNRGFHVVVDSAAQRFEEIHISGGERGLNILIASEALCSLTKAIVAPISTD